MGSEDPCGGPDERCTAHHRVCVGGFWTNATEVTNEQFTKFVAATGYVVIAEQRPNPADFLVHDLTLSRRARAYSRLLRGQLAWTITGNGGITNRGASCRHPEGPASEIRGQDRYPVVHVALSRR